MWASPVLVAWTLYMLAVDWSCRAHAQQDHPQGKAPEGPQSLSLNVPD